MDCYKSNSLGNISGIKSQSHHPINMPHIHLPDRTAHMKSNINDLALPTGSRALEPLSSANRIHRCEKFSTDFLERHVSVSVGHTPPKPTTNHSHRSTSTLRHSNYQIRHKYLQQHEVTFAPFPSCRGASCDPLWLQQCFYPAPGPVSRAWSCTLVSC